MRFWRQEYWSGLPFPSPVDHVLLELSIKTRPSWEALHGMAHSFIELDKAVVHVIRLVTFFDCGFQSVCPLMEKDKRVMEASWWERLTQGETGKWNPEVNANQGFTLWRAGCYNLPAHHWIEGYHFPRIAPEIMSQVPILAGVVVSFRIPGRDSGLFKRVTEDNARNGLSQRYGQGVGCRQRWEVSLDQWGQTVSTEPRPGEEKATGGPGEMGSWRRLLDTGCGLEGWM